MCSLNCTTANKLASECLCVCQTWTTHSESTRSGWVTTLNQWQGRSLRRQKRSWTSWCHSRTSWSVACISNHHYHPPFFAYKTYDKTILWTSRTSNVQRPNGFIVLSCIVTKTGVFAEEGPENHLPNCMWYAIWVRVCICWCTAPLCPKIWIGEEVLSLHHTIRQLFTWPSPRTAWFRNSFPASATHCLPKTNKYRSFIHYALATYQ